MAGLRPLIDICLPLFLKPSDHRFIEGSVDCVVEMAMHLATMNQHQRAMKTRTKMRIVYNSMVRRCDVTASNRDFADVCRGKELSRDMMSLYMSRWICQRRLRHAETTNSASEGKELFPTSKESMMRSQRCSRSCQWRWKPSSRHRRRCCRLGRLLRRPGFQAKPPCRSAGNSSTRDIIFKFEHLNHCFVQLLKVC